jgi:hypothetical protein
MTGTQLFDCLSEDTRRANRSVTDSDTLEHLAEQMVGACATSGQMLQDMRQCMFPVDERPESLAIANTLRREFQHWAAGAEEILERATAVSRSERAVAGLSRLRDLYGVTMAMLQITPEAHLEALRRAPSLPPMSIEELRRELHLIRRP